MRVVALLVSIVLLTARISPAADLASVDAYVDHLNSTLVDYYVDPARPIQPAALQPPDQLIRQFDPVFQSKMAAAATVADPPTAVATIRGLLQQACVVEMAKAVRAGDLAAAQRWRCELLLPRGVSAADGAVLLDTLGQHADKRDEAARILTREAITWQTTRVRQLIATAMRAAGQSIALPDRLREELAEARTLASLPQPLLQAAGLPASSGGSLDAERATITVLPWNQLADALPPFRNQIEAGLPSLLTDKEKNRQERLLLKLVMLAPGEYSRGVRDGKIAVPLEYREAVSFTAQARQLLGELTPAWLGTHAGVERREAIDSLDKQLESADQQIAKIAAPDELAATLKNAANILEDKLGVSLRRSGTTADIVDEVMLETRKLLDQSLSAALDGQWKEAEQLRLEAYTTYDPELEARLMPRDPQLASDIERLLLDGIDQKGVKVLLDERGSSDELQHAYARAHDGLQRATALLKSDISPTAAVLNAGSIVLREGLEGLLVIVAIFAGLRGPENAHKRRLFWVGIVASVVATILTWILSQTLITSLRAYGELIEAIAGAVAIVVLLLITNWLFHQIYWKQWISTLKAQAADGESVWALVTAGFAVGYREGLETVLFLQSLVLDAGGTTVAIGVIIGCTLLIVLGVAALRLGLKLPYFKLLLITAGMIGLVLVTFTGTTVRAMQTVGWVPVHRLTGGSWPIWLGTWLGVHNTLESVGGQLTAIALVIGTWRVAKMQSKRKREKRARELAENGATSDKRFCRLDANAKLPIASCSGIECGDSPSESSPIQVRIARPILRSEASVDDPTPAEAM